ncbi:MAG TPA: energy-coupling factor ABC transporter ATP-binding protein [Candidatus Sulfotelmatobacter sp.]|jgi:energy-coupling factor transport system ATP-binding protein|nr:energy-coupling factor ABC transporter ATP-binding protein [Candidatus Sulfotelmatobacter sp.]
MTTGISLKNVSVSYTRSIKQLKDINLQIKNGTFLGITGSNGSGKTTLLQLLNGLIPHEIQAHLEGDVFIDDINTKTKPVSYFARKIGMLFQNPDFMLFNLTVAEEIAFGLKNLKLTNHSERIKNALNIVGLSGYETRDPHALSLGQKQKVALACVLAMDTPYIVLDEPVAMLDYKAAINLYQTLNDLNKNDGKTIIVVEHDTDFLMTYAKEVAVIDKGEIVMQGTTRLVFTKKAELKHFGIKNPQPTQ